MNLEKLMENPYAWLVLATCTIGAMIFALYTWFAGKERKEISFSSNSFKIINAGKSTIPELQLLYQNKAIDNLTITRFAIWNSGNRVISSDDIVAVKPLTLACHNNETKILDATIIKQGEPTNMFKTIRAEEDKFILDFDYIDKQDGIVLQVLHTGPSINLELECKIKGGKNLKHLNKRANKKIPEKARKLISIIALGIECIMTFSLAIIFYLVSYDWLPPELLAKVAFLNSDIKSSANIMVVLSIILVIMYYQVFKKNFHLDIPSTLRDEFEYPVD